MASNEYFGPLASLSHISKNKLLLVAGVVGSTKDVGGCLKMNESIITSVDGCNATTVATFANESASVTVTSDGPIANAGNE